MTDHLLIWTLGPVQQFIEAARKSQDLWVGSFLFSSLMEEALAVVQRPAEVIYPFETTIDPQLRIPDLPNTFVVSCTRPVFDGRFRYLAAQGSDFIGFKDRLWQVLAQSQAVDTIQAPG
jgi:hypothetical protein